MKNSVYALLLLFSFITLPVSAQESAPSLSIGLDNVLFGRGVIDVELLTAIISEKQDELKKRIVEKEILKPVYKNSSFATSNYAFSVVKELMNEKDKNVLKKEILEHTVNYALVCAFAEMYVQLCWDEMKDQTYLSRLKINTNYEFENNWKPAQNANDFLNAKLFLTSKVSVKKKGKEQAFLFNKVLMDALFHAIRNNESFIDKGFFSKPLYFDHYQYSSQSYYLKNTGDPFVDSLYRDVDRFVTDIGEMYEMFNEVLKYTQIQGGGKQFDLQNFKEDLRSKIDTSINQLNLDAAERLRKDLDGAKYGLKLVQYAITEDSLKLTKKLNALKDYNVPDLEQLKYKVIVNHQWNEEIIKTYFDIKTVDTAKLVSVYADIETGTQNVFNVSFQKTQIFKEISKLNNRLQKSEEIRDSYEKLRNEASTSLAEVELLINGGHEERMKHLFLNPLKKELQQLAKGDSLGNKMDSVMLKLYQHYYYIQSNYEEAMNLDYVYKLKTELLPQLGYFNLKYGGQVSEVMDLFEGLLAHLQNEIYEPILERFEDEFDAFSAPFQEIFGNGNMMQLSYLKFFEKLDQLDKMETYYYLLQDVLEAGELSGNRDVANAMNLILESVEKYTEFDGENDRIDIDVESVIQTLYLKYGNRDKNPFNFYMTLGLNTNFAFNPDTSKNYVNFNSASEKIGMKINLYNAKLRSSYAYGEGKARNTDKPNEKEELNYRSEDPILSDVHVLIFGSGLLYQVANLTTSENIGSTFIGAGLGTTFYNGLCFNASCMFPIYEDQGFGLKSPYFSIGFDIQFVDYLTALNKKRKENKLAKQEAEMELEMKKLEVEKLKAQQLNK